MIIREKRPEGFTQIPNSTLRDASMKPAVHQLLMYMLSMSDNWVFRNSVVMRGQKIKSESTLRDYYRELVKHGYLENVRVTDEKGRVVRWDKILHEKPLFPGAENTNSGEGWY